MHQKKYRLILPVLRNVGADSAFLTMSFFIGNSSVNAKTTRLRKVRQIQGGLPKFLLSNRNDNRSERRIPGLYNKKNTISQQEKWSIKRNRPDDL
jgi:hypothetical protein